MVLGHIWKNKFQNFTLVCYKFYLAQEKLSLCGSSAAACLIQCSFASLLQILSGTRQILSGTTLCKTKPNFSWTI